MTQFFPVDITYTVKDGKPLILMYGRSEGKRVCVAYPFKPYFVVEGDIDKAELSKLKEGQNYVTDVQKTKKNVNEHEHEVFLVFTNVPSAVPVIKDVAKKLPGVEHVFEYDILFARRFLIDQGIIPMTEVEVEGEIAPSHLKIPLIQATSVKQKENGETLVKPRMLAIDIETYNPGTNRIDYNHPILMVALYGENFKRVVTWKKFETDEDYIEFVTNEADMLQRIVELVEEYAPEMILGYFTDGFDFPYLVERAKKLKVKLSLGLDNSEVQMRGRVKKEATITGIAHFDVFKFIRYTIGRSMDTDVFSLNAVAKELLGEEKHDVDMDVLYQLWDEGSDKLNEYAIYNLKDVDLTYRLAEKILPNLIELVRIIQLPLQDVSRMSLSQQVEWFLAKQAHTRNEVILNKPSHREESARMGDRIKGAFVFEPKPGFYKDIIVFDYRSLYPTIIASHNISKGNISRTPVDNAFTIETDRGQFWYAKDKDALFSTVISELIERRAAIKKEMKTNKDPLLEARSIALKYLANSFYGYMGFAPARWYCKECAESTTAWARKYITDTIEKAQAKGFKVLYGDTDSIFLLLEEKSVDDAKAFVEEINKDLPGLMELEFENHYPAGIFVSTKSSEEGAKKKYAMIDNNQQLKVIGFETVRRNWSVIAKETQRKVLELVLKGETEEAKTYVLQVIDDLRNNKLPVEKLVIRTKITKAIESYESIGPHVAVAQQMKEKGIPVGAGSIVSYVVVKGKGRIRDKAKIPTETEQDEYDGEYYITHQIIPGIERIFAVLNIFIDGSESAQSSLADF